MSGFSFLRRCSLTAGALLLGICLVFSISCGAGAQELLAYQSEALCLRVAYETGATPLEARLTLAAGNADRDFSLTILSPEGAADLTFARREGQLTASGGDLTLPIAGLDAALAPLSLFCIPTDAVVSDITRAADGGRSVTLSRERTTWVLHLAPDGTVPTCIERTSETGYFSMTVLEVLK